MIPINSEPSERITYSAAGLQWHPLTCDRADEVMSRISQVCESWAETPYMAGQQAKGKGVDCIRFVCGALDELFGLKNDIPREVQDIAMHNPKGALRVMRMIQEFYPEHYEVDRTKGSYAYPGDVIVVAQGQSGPGHAILVGAQRNTLFQALKKGVKKCGFGFAAYYQNIYAIFRCKDPQVWLPTD